MKTRLILAGMAGALLLTLLSASPASASEETVGSCVAEVLETVGLEHAEDIMSAGFAEGASDAAVEELVAFEEELEDCLEAPNPILPATNEIIWGSLSFSVLLFFMVWKGFPAVKKILTARSEQIAGDLDSADKAKAEALEVKAQYEAELADAKTEAAGIIEEARQQAGTVRADLQARAETDIAEMRTKGAADVQAARGRAMEDLQTELADIVVGAAERVVEANLDHAAQTQLIENYINQVGSR